MISNRCTGLVVDGEIVAFSSSPDCGSFVPATEPQVPERPATPRRRQPSPEDVALSLMDRAIALAPDPQLRLAPARVGLTGLDSFFWLASPPRPITAAAGVGGFSVTAEARPIQYVWDFGDGVNKTTSHSGRRWSRRRPGNIPHLYETRGRYDVAVEVIWEARWRLGAGAWRHLGYFSTSDSVDYPVRQVVALLVPTG